MYLQNKTFYDLLLVLGTENCGFVKKTSFIHVISIRFLYNTIW